jgi:SM-20-related protein
MVALSDLLDSELQTTVAEVLTPQPTLIAPQIYQQITDALSESGWIVVPQFVSAEVTAELRAESMQQWQQAQFHQAGVGKGERFAVRQQIRSDSVMWLDPGNCSPVYRNYLNIMDELLSAINSSLYLGLHEFEGHAAIYPQGSYYQRHLDQFQGDNLRTVTAILYLNEAWSKADGGELRIYTSTEDDSYQEVLPLAGQLVVFLSARFPHEVMTAHKTRLSLTGWFKRHPHNLFQ